MNIYSVEEIERIKKVKETNERLEDFFKTRREEWSSNIEPLYEVFRMELNNQSAKKIMEAQATSLSYRQKINDEISVFLDKRSKQDVKLKKLRQDKFLYYATSFGVKTNTSEKTIMIEAHISEESRNIEIIENYIEFLRASSKNIESLQFTIKNMIELFNYLGKY
jgi:hypothetical protein